MASVSGNSQDNVGFLQLISSGVVQPLNLNAQILRNLSYTNGTGANQVNTIYAKQLTLSAAATTVDFLSALDMNGSSTSFARIRELIVQNIGSADCRVYANSTSGVAWLPSGSTSALFARAATTASSITSTSAMGGIVKISDPQSATSLTGNLITASGSKVVFDPGANSTTINVIVVGANSSS